MMGFVVVVGGGVGDTCDAPGQGRKAARRRDMLAVRVRRGGRTEGGMEGGRGPLAVSAV